MDFFYGDVKVSITRGSALHRINISLTVWWSSVALALPQHGSQAFHHLMLSVMQIGSFGGEQLYRLSNALGLVDGTLLADGQMHGQMQKRVALAVVKLTR